MCYQNGWPIVRKVLIVVVFKNRQFLDLRAQNLTGATFFKFKISTM